MSTIRPMAFAALVLAALLSTACDGPSKTAPTSTGGGIFSAAPGDEIRFPTRLAIGPGDTIYVSDVEADRVYAYRDGVRTLELNGLAGPLGLAIAGNRLYVGCSGRHAVEVYDIASRTYVATLATDFLLPNAIAVASDGTVVVADSRAGTVRAFSSTGDEQSAISGLRFPSAVAVTDSNTFVGEQGTSRILVYDRSGKRVRELGGEIPVDVGQRNGFEGRFSRIQGLAVADGRLYVLDAYHGHVQVLDPETGAFHAILGRLGGCPTCLGLALDVAVGSDGHVWVADPDHRRWLAVDAAAEVAR